MNTVRGRAMERGNSGRRLLVWDAPNMDMCLSEVIGERASAATRPNLGAVNEWMRSRAEPTDMVESCVFCNVPPGFESAMGHWVVSLRHAGFAVFVKPKRRRHDDVDAEMLRHIERRVTQGSLVSLVVASHDAKAFAAPLRRYAEAGVRVEVLGYREKDTFAAGDPQLEFIDVEDVPGAFARPLPRTNLFGLPAAGRWFEPFPAAPTGGGRPAAPTAGAGSASVPPVGAQPHAADAATDRGAPGGAEARSEPPARGEVLALVEAEVVAAVDAGRGGLGLREVGDLLRLRFPRFALEELGFASVGDLVDAVAEPERLLVVRRSGGHVVTIAGASAGPLSLDASAPSITSPGPRPPAGAGAGAASVGELPEPGDELGRGPRGGPVEPADVGPGAADRSDEGRRPGPNDVDDPDHDEHGDARDHGDRDDHGGGDDRRDDGGDRGRATGADARTGTPDDGGSGERSDSIPPSSPPAEATPPSRLSLVHPIYRAFGVDRTA